MRSAVAAPRQLEGLSLELVPEESLIRPGVPFSVGLHIRHATGFHTYWKHPGIVGVPTKITWKLPAGFVAGPIEWPKPQLSTMAIYPVYGYEGDVLLPVTITPPVELNPADIPEVTLCAKVSWMCCSKTCHPGFADLTLSLPTGTKDAATADTVHAPLFHTARDAQPIQTDSWLITASRDKDKIVAEVHPAAGISTAPINEPETIYFFSSDGLIDSRAPQQIKTLSGDTSAIKIALTVSEHAPKPAADGSATRLIGVLTAKFPWIPGSSATAIEVDVPIATGNDYTGDH